MQIDLKCKLIIRYQALMQIRNKCKGRKKERKKERKEERFFILFNFYTKLDSYGRKKIWRKKEVG